MNILIDNMIYGAIGLLFGLAVLTVYALIQLGRRNIMTFFLIPIALVASLYAGYTMFALQGTPINKLPEGQVEVLWVEVQKPTIFFTIRYLGTTQPVYFKIPYTDDNAKKMNELGEQAEKGMKVEGEFKKADGDKADLSQRNEIQFDEIKRFPLPTKKSQLRRDGVDPRIITAIHDQDDQGEDTATDYDVNGVP
jgi:hypothetical protein